MKRIMIVTNSLTGGGAERSMNLVANELTARGIPVALVPINAGSDDQVVPKCEVYPLERQWRGSLSNTITSLWSFNRLVWAWKPDFIVLNCDLPELFGALLLSNQKLVAVEHINHPWITRQRFGRFVRKVLEIRKTTWVAVSNHLTIWPNQRVPYGILLNPIVVTSKPISSNSQHLESSQKLKRLVCIGRLAEQKRPGWVLEIAAQAKLPVEFIGDGKMHEQLKATATIKNLQATFLGQVLDPWASLKLGDLLIIPSKYEGDGLVVIEALHHGVPMLIADIPDFRRFGFPEANYCKSINDFVQRISSYRNDISELLIPEELSLPILESRSVRAVGDSWEGFLVSI